MTKKKRAVLIVILVLVLALAAAFWYTRPMPLWGLSASPEAKVFATIDQWYVGKGSEDLDDDTFQLALQPGDPEYQQLVELLSRIQVRRRLSALLPRAVTVAQGKQMNEGMVNWYLHFSGVGFQYFAGDFYLSHDGYDFICTVVNHDDAAEELTDFLLNNSVKID